VPAKKQCRLRRYRLRCSRVRLRKCALPWQTRTRAFVWRSCSNETREDGLSFIWLARWDSFYFFSSLSQLFFFFFFPPFLSFQLGKLSLAFTLLELGADVNATTPNGATGLHFLALLSKEEASPSAVYLQLLAELLRKGASLTLVNAVGESVLHLATSRKNEVAVAFFVDAGCDLNLQTKQGETALHYAVAQNCAALVSLLLGKGAQDRANSSSQTAEQAAKAKHPELAALFQLPRVSRSSNASSTGTLSKSQRIAIEPRSVASSPASAAPMLSPTGSSVSDEIVAWEVPDADPFADEEMVR
jgi:hypothetical protein